MYNVFMFNYSYFLFIFFFLDITRVKTPKNLHGTNSQESPSPPILSKELFWVTSKVIKYFLS